jgi:hypothetical protein
VIIDEARQLLRRDAVILPRPRRLRERPLADDFLLGSSCRKGRRSGEAGGQGNCAWS